MRTYTDPTRLTALLVVAILLAGCTNDPTSMPVEAVLTTTAPAPSTLTPEPTITASPTVPPWTGCIFFATTEKGPDAPKVVSYLRIADGSSETLAFLPSDILFGDFSLSPDHMQVAYVSPVSREIRIYDIATGEDELLYLPPEGYHATTPQWSSNGEFLAFKRVLPGNLSILDLSSGEVALLTSYDSEDMMATGRAAWSPDNTQLAFSVVETVDGKLLFDLYSINRDGSNLTKLTDAANDAYQNLEPRWSPDGQQIVFRRVSDLEWGVWLYDLGTGAMQNLTEAFETDAEQYRRLDPVWSTDGEYIAFLVEDSPNRGEAGGDIYIMPRDGSRFERIARIDAMYSFLMEWSACPD